MTKIYLVRHAEAEGNIFRRAHGHYNGLITPGGDKQIELLSKRFEGEHIDAVYSSDLTRAVDTAMAVSEPRNMQIMTARALREVDMGSWEDVTWGDIEYYHSEMNYNFGHDPAKWKIDGGEPYDDVINRMQSFLQDTAKRHDGGTIALFSHGFAIRALLCALYGVASHESYKVPYCDNTAVTLITYDNGIFSIEFAGDNSHLDGGNSTLEKQSWWKAKEKRYPENLRFLPLSDAAPDVLIEAFVSKAGQRAHADVQYAAYIGDEPVAILGLDTLKEADENAGRISYIYVAENHRGNRFGVQAVGAAVSDFRKLRREKLRIGLPSGSPCIAFFEKCGFDVLNNAGTVCQMEKNIKNWQ